MVSLSESRLADSDSVGSMPARPAPRSRGILPPDLPPDSLGDEAVGHRWVEVDDPEDEAVWDESVVTGTFAGLPDACVEVTRSVVRSVPFTGTQFEEFAATDVVFDGCEFSGAGLVQANLVRVEFRNCRLRASAFGAAVVHDVRFVDCQLDDASLRMCRGDHVGFEGCSMRSADLYGSELAQVHLYNCDLTGAELSHAKLRGARLHGSTLDGVHGVESLHGTVIDAALAVPLGLLLLGAAGITIDDADS